MTTNLTPKEQLAERYANKRVKELLSMTKKELAEYTAALEVELMDLSDSVLDDDFSRSLSVNSVDENLDSLDEHALNLMKNLDSNDEVMLEALWKYRTV
ncbi:hypothetical protein ACMZ6Z_06925 [Streptococcus pluranimalium]|uniref:hypothetical protein n=1 Tax=Streptococcus pluranimalium TaxID=82348 RepID=UPI0039FCA24F